MKKLLGSKVIGRRYEILEETNAIAIWSEADAKLQKLLESNKIPEEKQQDYIALQVFTDEITERTLKAGNIVLTTLSCYNVCTTIIRVMGELRAKGQDNGGAIIFGKESDLRCSGLSTLIEFTPRCIFVPVDDQKIPKEESEALAEEYKAYKQLVKDTKDADPDAEINKEILISGKTKSEMIAWKFISALADGAYFICKSYRSLSEASNVLAREMINTNPNNAYVYRGSDAPSALLSRINPKTYPSKVKTFKGTGEILFDAQEAFNLIFDTNEKLHQVKTKLIEDVDFSNVEDNVERITLTGHIKSVGAAKIVSVLTSYLSADDIENFEGKEKSLFDDDDIEDEKIAAEIFSLEDVLPEDYFDQVGSVIATNLESGNTLLLPADKHYGVTSIDLAYKHITSYKVPGQVVILEGDIDYDTPEGMAMDELLDKMRKLPNVAFIKFRDSSIPVVIPNQKAVEKRKENEKDEINAKVSVGDEFAYILASLCDSIKVLKSGKMGTLRTNALNYFAKDRGDTKIVQEYNMKQGVFQEHKIDYSKIKENIKLDKIKGHQDQAVVEYILLNGKKPAEESIKSF